MPFTVTTATFIQSATVSQIVNIQNATLFGVWAPVMTGSTMNIQGSWDQTSTNFVRLSNPAGSGDWTFFLKTGSVAVTLQDAVFPWPYIRLETQAQANTVAPLIVTKIR